MIMGTVPNTSAGYYGFSPSAQKCSTLPHVPSELLKRSWLIATIVAFIIVTAVTVFFIYPEPIERKSGGSENNKLGGADSSVVTSVSSRPLSTSQHSSDVRPVFLPPDEAKNIIATRAEAVTQAMEQKDVFALAKLVHPAHGVRFCTWPEFSRTRMCSQALLPSDIETLHNRSEPILLGGHPVIEKDVFFAPLTEGFGRFLAKDAVAYNPISPEGPGDGPFILEEVHEAFPESLFVAYHFTGTEESSRLDWRKVFHVFQKYTDGQWYLVAAAEYYQIP